MGNVLGSLYPSTCSRLEEAESLLGDRSKTDKDQLSQVLMEHGLLTEDEWRNMVNISSSDCYFLMFDYSIACLSVYFAYEHVIIDFPLLKNLQ